MFTTGNHAFLSASAGCFIFCFILFLRKKEMAAKLLFLFSFILLSLYLVGRGFLAGDFIINPVFEGAYFLPWCLALVAAATWFTEQKEYWGWLMIPLAVFTGFAYFYPNGIIPPTPQKMTVLTLLFFITELGAHALFYAGAVFAFIALRKNFNPSFYHSYLVWGFVVFSVSQIVGAMWSYMGWGNTFSWNPRHMSTAFLWLMYAAYIHLKYIPEWNSRKKGWFAVVASIIVVIISYSHYIHELKYTRIGG